MSEFCINHLTDNDLYTFTVGKAVLDTFPDANFEYNFINRKGTRFNDAFFDKLQANVDNMANLRLHSTEKLWMKHSIPFLSLDYLDYLSNYRFDPSEVQIKNVDGNLDLKIVGPGHRTIFWEVPLLATISQCYYETVDTEWSSGINKANWILDQAKRAKDKGDLIENAIISPKFLEFGTRRRRSFDTQKVVINELRHVSSFMGTSNVYMAMTFDLKAHGTMSHQWIMANAALESLRYANRYALNNWNKVYKGDLGIALPDTFGVEAFFGDFDKQLARLFDGVRHDSGDPFEFADKVVKHYRKLRLNPMSKTIVFSDSLDIALVLKLQTYCEKIGIRCGFGIGTHFTNDFPGSPALNIVIKLRAVQAEQNAPWTQVVKLSDVPTKATGDADALRVARYTFFGSPLDQA